MITALQFIVFTTYLIVIWKRFDIQASISHSTYAWVGNEKHWFTAMCILLGILNLFQGMEIWGWLTTAGLFIVGATPDFLEDRTRSYYLHPIGACMTVLFPFVGLYVMNGIWLPFALFAPATLLLYKNDVNVVWWIEVIALPIILIGYEMR